MKSTPHNGACDFGIWQHHRISGVVGFHPIEHRNKKVSMGYWLGAEAQGQGLATRAAQALVEYASTVMKLHRVEIRAATENVRSRRVAERLGFEFEGIAREAELLYDRYVDQAMYGKIFLSR